MSVTQRDHIRTKSTGGHAAPRTRGRARAGAAAAAPWAGPAAVVLGILLVRNTWLFTVPEYEDADLGAYSIQVEQARRFALLVGNYSREKFNHPGPAFLYVQAWGEDAWFAATRLVPAAWNGQVAGVYLLSAFFAASVVVVAARWGGARAGLVALAAVGLLGALHPSVFSSIWMPYEYVPAYLAFLVSAASVAAGRTEHAWLAALSGWFLIHGHACFLLFVPLISVAALVARLAPLVRTRTRPRTLQLPARRVWLPVAVISAVFALPIVIELAVAWPGNFGKYFAYSGSSQSGGHPATAVAQYALWFWWPHAGAAPAVFAALLTLAAVTAAWRLPGGPVRRLSLALLAVDAVSTAAFIVYASTGVDELNQYYIGYFYWTAPLLAFLVLALASVELLAAHAPGRPGRQAAATVIAAGAAVTCCTAFAVAPQTQLTMDHADPANPAATGPIADPSLPAGVAKIAAIARGRPVVLEFPHDAWPAVTGLLVTAERTGVNACVADPSWEFMMTSQFICTPAELKAGRRFSVWGPGEAPKEAPVVTRLRRGIVTAGPM